MRWWQSGLLGAFTLCAATGVKAIVIVPIALLRGTYSGVDVAHAAGFAAAVFAMGFICGVVGWAGRGLSRQIGWLGDSLTGLAIMLVFFLCCMILFDPEMLGSNFRSGGLPMFCLAAVLGVVCGPWFARDLRREWRQFPHQADRHAVYPAGALDRGRRGLTLSRTGVGAATANEQHYVTQHEASGKRSVLPYSTPTVERPFWVKLGLWGLPNRRSAWVFFWICIAIAAFCAVRGFSDLKWFWGVLMVLAAFGYLASIRWVDRHGNWN